MKKITLAALALTALAAQAQPVPPVPGCEQAPTRKCIAAATLAEAGKLQDLVMAGPLKQSSTFDPQAQMLSAIFAAQILQLRLAGGSILAPN